MTGRDIVLSLIKETGINQTNLAKLVGMKGQSNVSMALKTDMKLSVFTRFINALGYEVIIIPKKTGRKPANSIPVTLDEE